MSIITFWNDDREQSRKTLTSVAVATRMAIDRNFKVLLMSTSFRDSTMKNCFFGDEVQRNLKIFGGKSNNIAVENGIEGLSKLVTSKKITPEVITDYTKVVFKGRLEVLCGYVGAGDKTVDENYSEYERLEESYIDLIRNANLYYDMVVVDLDKNLKKEVKDEIKRISNLNIFVFSHFSAPVFSAFYQAVNLYIVYDMRIFCPCEIGIIPMYNLYENFSLFRRLLNRIMI